MPLTNREALAKLYPDHFQRIVEVMWEQRIVEPEYELNMPWNGWYDIGNAFVWAKTTEGFNYWRRLWLQTPTADAALQHHKIVT